MRYIIALLCFIAMANIASGMMVVAEIIEHNVYYENGKIVHEIRNHVDFELENVTVIDRVDGRIRKIVIDKIPPKGVVRKGYDAGWLGRNVTVEVESQVVYYMAGEKHVTVPKKFEVFVPSMDYKTLLAVFSAFVLLIFFSR